MLDLADLGKYRENNRIEAKKATGGFPEKFMGKLFRVCQYDRRDYPVRS